MGIESMLGVEPHIREVVDGLETATAANTARVAANQADSTATDAAGIVADFNTLLAALKTAGLMVADEE